MTLLTMALPLWLHYFVYTHQGMTAAKRDLDDAQKQRDIDARKREKREFELERQKLREKLAQVRVRGRARGRGMVTEAAREAGAGEQQQ